MSQATLHITQPTYICNNQSRSTRLHTLFKVSFPKWIEKTENKLRRKPKKPIWMWMKVASNFQAYIYVCICRIMLHIGLGIYRLEQK